MVLFFLLLILLVTAAVGTLILIIRSVRACLRWIRLRYSFDLHIPQMAHRFQRGDDPGPADQKTS
jgi:hypothetical protein